MPLNKVKGNMYNWITNSFNPIGGECPYMCSYCYVKKFRFPSLKEKYSGQPRLYENELKRNLGKDKFWFICSCLDLFAEAIPEKWIKDTLKHCHEFDNAYLFQSKNPSRIWELRCNLPDNSIIGTTIESNRTFKEMCNAPNVIDRAGAMLKLSPLYKTMLTIEPVCDFDLDPMIELIQTCKPNWINIGANTNSKVKLTEPSPKKVMDLIDRLSTFTKVKIKSNLKRLMVTRR